MSTSKTGKHGHAKVHLIAIDIFTGKKLEDLSPSTHNMDVPNVNRTEYQLVNIDDGFLNLMTNDGTSKDDVKVPDSDIGQQIEEAFEDGKDIVVTILTAMGEEAAVAWKEAPDDYYEYVLCLDVRQYHLVFNHLTDMRNNYLKAHVLFAKNMKRLADPRGEGSGDNRNVMSMF